MKKSFGSNIISDNNFFNLYFVDEIIEHLIILKNQIVRHCWPCWNFPPSDIITSTLPANKLTNQFKIPSKFSPLTEAKLYNQF